jgi:PDZ domain-containing protein
VTETGDSGRSLAQRFRGVSERTRTLIVSLVALGALVLLAIALPVPYVKLAPGPTFNVLGEVDGEPFIRIEGTTTYPVTGNLDMTTARESGGPRGGLTFVEAIGAWFSTADAVVPRELIYPDDVTGEEVRRRQAALFSTSESDAVGAALSYLGIPVSTEVVATAVLADAPAGRFFEPRDTIVSVDGTPITEPGQVVDIVRSKPIGSTFDFEVERVGETVSFEIASEPNPDDPQLPQLGVSVGLFFTPDFDIDFTLQDVGGPSAGLMFATGIVDKLTLEDLTAGGHVAGSGTIDPEGNVGGVGSIRQKLAGARDAGAELFLLPERQCAEAEGHIPDGLTVVPVTTLTEAIDAIRAWTAGETLRTCPAQD